MPGKILTRHSHTKNNPLLPITLTIFTLLCLYITYRNLLGFSLTHLSGTGIPDLGDFLFIPGTGEMKLDPGTREEPEKGYRSRYSHEKEWASPNYYAVEHTTTYP